MRQREEIEKWLDDKKDYDPSKVETKGVIYVAGPMRGYPELNFPAFYEATDGLKEEGWVVLNPAETPMGLKSPKAYLLIDLMMLAEADAIYMMKGWEDSKGACLEHAWAEVLGIEIFYED